ncbi:MAG: glycosyltransferase family 2 protein [Lachnospiraceae bacterium]|jgi:glycosyltransferase involved in cell wall biosynthesis|nr:glycosyltransferase family 2 protein [Lachnospiraceae bacterium]
MTSKQNPLISIIVPVFNSAPYVERCLLSIKNQTYQNIEIILVNDGSTDESGAICDQYAAVDERIIVRHQENGGLTAAWQQGFLLSKGSYVCFVDSDDHIELNMIDEMKEHLSSEWSSSEVICCNAIVERTYFTANEQHGLYPGEYTGDLHQEIFKKILGNEQRLIITSRCMKLISRELISANLKYCDDKLRDGEDVAIILSVLFDSQRIVIMKEGYFYHYHYHHESMVHGYIKDKWEQKKLFLGIIYNVMTQKVAAHHLPISAEEVMTQCKREHIFMLMQVMKNEARGNPDGRAYYRRVKEICRSEKTRELTKRYPIAVKEKANRLLYMTLCYPWFTSFLVLRLATKAFYRKRRK